MYSEEHQDEDCTSASGHYNNALFARCEFKKLNGLTLEQCVLLDSKFTTDNIKDALGFTLTLDCHSFTDVEFSPLLFDLFLLLAIKSKGNDLRRRQLVEVLGGRKRVIELLRQLEAAELSCNTNR